MKTDIYNAQGKKTGSVELPENIFNVAWNDALMHQVVTVMQNNARTPVAHTKTRGEVRGGGRKPWKQKGTGRSRHGSSRSPIWRAGGVTHGPRNDTVFARALPKKMRAKALFMALSRKLKEGHVVFVDSFGIEEPKTALALKTLLAVGKGAGFDKFGTKKKNAALVAFADPSESRVKSFRNISCIETKAVRDLNPVAVLRHSYLVIENPDASIAILNHRTKKTADTPEKKVSAYVAKKRASEKADQ